MADVQPDLTVYRILRPAEWAGLAREGVFEGSDSDRRDGFIHFSRKHQLAETARAHFADETRIVLLEVSTGDLIDFMNWEESRGGELFPHLYGTFGMDDVRRVWELEREGGDWPWPKEFRGA